MGLLSLLRTHCLPGDLLPTLRKVWTVPGWIVSLVVPDPTAGTWHAVSLVELLDHHVAASHQVTDLCAVVHDLSAEFLVVRNKPFNLPAQFAVAGDMPVLCWLVLPRPRLIGRQPMLTSRARRSVLRLPTRGATRHLGRHMHHHLYQRPVRRARRRRNATAAASGTTPLPVSRNRSTQGAIPSATRRTAGSNSRGHSPRNRRSGGQ